MLCCESLPGDSWDAKCAAAWKLHGLSVATQRQQQPAARKGQAAAGPVSTVSGGELGVRIDRLAFAKQQAPLPRLGIQVASLLRCHCRLW